MCAQVTLRVGPLVEDPPPGSRLGRSQAHFGSVPCFHSNLSSWRVISRSLAWETTPTVATKVAARSRALRVATSYHPRGGPMAAKLPRSPLEGKL